MITLDCKLAARTPERQRTTVDVGGVRIGAEEIVVIAGPCSVENEEQILATAQHVRAAGAHMLRGGAYKPRTSPYAFRGLGEEGLQLLAKAREATDLPVVTEVMTPADVGLVAEYADMLQIGARNMQNFHLLEAVGRIQKPVLLKRGMSGTIQEWLLAAEYILNCGNPNVVLCERGIRTFEPSLRNTLDLGALAFAKELSHLPVIADPSHGVGRRSLVGPLALASLAAGADGLILEVHPHPERSVSDSQQTVDCAEFADIMLRADAVASAVGRRLHLPAITPAYAEAADVPA
ncbi:MAG TPA: 3-deoxy-7-phosphoheptulonate synthase [Herpetosiphon sp.]|uniref:Phospho-2-dehydro-3-deoxyheptonate aldolase n=1 Tax=Herpetosiphon aurantiacus (strain ATCC 23779 / DSM 785 / 114-95) TaxID=316274 RepID=A9AV21_HERA2|nr:3-deoxy-7-phosphoheptulonate synthase [Herpetosiphon sp.]ABX06609.1 phospho-2-dehydro-3-deoxyheptonate aldolase [Herpetosiphon aurantiacus DSM 785]HBW49274.1 3-deoxy-7-phosphoheptulonate synthase [Herpetosiphon sp.]